MEGLSGIGVVVEMFLLRLIVPLLITIALSWALHRLDAKWHPETNGEPDIERQKKGNTQGRHTYQWVLRRKAP